MSDNGRLKIVSIAHTAVSRDVGRRRYHPLAEHVDLDVHLVAPERWREFGRTIAADAGEDPGVTMHLEPVRLPNVPRFNWYLHHYPRLPRILEQVRPDVVHLWEEPWSLVALHAARLLGSAALVLEVDQNILKRLPPPFEAMRRHVLGRTTLVLARSGDAAGVVRACGYDGPIMPIGYGVDQHVFRPSGRNARASGRAPLHVAYVGRLVEEKGLDDMLAAMKLASCDLRLAIMGTGPYEQALRARAQALAVADRVSFRGWGKPAEVAEFFGAAHVSVLLTRTTDAVREQFGRAIIESQSCGVPVIGSACGAIPDVVADGGWIVPERDPAALARTLDQVAGSAEELDERARAGLANVARRFTYAQVANALAEAWRRAAAIVAAQRTSNI